MRTGGRDELVVGIGCESAGDDAVGLLVARAVAARGIAAVELPEPSSLLELIGSRRRVVVVDAFHSANRVGQLLQLRPDDLMQLELPVSSHGLSVAAVLALARVLRGPEALTGLDILGVAIDGNSTPGSASRAVRQSVGPAAALAVALLRRR